MKLNKELSTEIVVLELANPKIIVSNIDNNFRKELTELGFVGEDDFFFVTINLQDTDRRANLITELVLLGSLFQYGKNWSPAEIVQYFRDDLNKFQGNFKMISWLNSSEFVITMQ